MSDIDSNITLEEFQKGKIRFQTEDFIYYINNPDFYTRWDNMVHSPEIFKIFFDIMDRLKGFVKSCPEEKKVLFLGYTNTGIDSTKIIIKTLNSTNKLSGRENVVVLGKGDYELNDEFAKNIPGNIKFIFGNNVNSTDPRINYLPIGRDFRSSSLFSDFKPEHNKIRLCYCNFSVNTHSQRKILYKMLKNKDFIEFEHMGKFLRYKLSRFEYYKKVAESKYTICPRGNGIDTFRLWDSLYLGTIPIVVKEASFHEYLSDLPILFLDSYEQFAELTEEYLDNCYEEMLVKRYNYDKLRFSFWIDQIENC